MYSPTGYWAEVTFQSCDSLRMAPERISTTVVLDDPSFFATEILIEPDRTCMRKVRGKKFFG